MASKTLSKNFLPNVEDFYIPSIGKSSLNFYKKLYNVLPNKLVSMQSPGGKFYFEHCILDALIGSESCIVSISTRRSLGKVADGKTPRFLTDILKQAISNPLSNPENMTAMLLRSSLKNLSSHEEPAIEFINLKKRNTIPLELQKLIRPSMRFALGLPIIIGNKALGVIWCISPSNITGQKRIVLEKQLRSFQNECKEIISHELESTTPDSTEAKRNIERIDTNSLSKMYFLSRYAEQKIPVKTKIALSFSHNIEYRTDSNIIIPTAKGFSISLKRYQSKKLLKSKHIILMIPGFFCNRGLMDTLAKEMSLTHSHLVYTMDLRGRSKLTLPGRKIVGRGWTVDEYIWEDFPAALTWLKREHPDEKVIVYGHSMGGMIPRFYTGSYLKGLQLYKNLPKPDDSISGIVTITSPTYISIEPDLPGFHLLKKTVRTIGKNKLSNALLKLLTSSITPAVPGISLPEFFKFLHNTGDPVRKLSFKAGSGILTLRNFVGYKQITAPEWYLLLEDIFCKESFKCIAQFAKSQIQEKGYLSYNDKINYTEDQKNFTLPLFTIAGSVDKIAPPATVASGYTITASNNKEFREFPQGHLGIILHKKTVEQIANETNNWIKKL